MRRWSYYKSNDFRTKVRRFVTIVGLFIVLLSLLACSSKTYRPVNLQPTSNKIIVQEKIVTVKCKIPKIDCEFTGDNYVPTKKLIECISLQKKAIEVCNEN